MFHRVPNQAEVGEIDSTVTSKGQITIPVSVRRQLGIDPGDKLTFAVAKSGEVNLRTTRYPTVASVRGAAGALKTPLTWQEVRQIAREDKLKAGKL
jgi:AbrB family looped-hinge helix DNA binding protein